MRAEAGCLADRAHWQRKLCVHVGTHLPMFGDKSLDAITTVDVERLKASLSRRSPKTVNNVLTVLIAALKKAVEWGVIERMPCVIKLLPVPKGTAKCHDFGSYGRLVHVAERHGSLAHLAVLLGGEAGLRCGEMMALEWTDLDLEGRQMCVPDPNGRGASVSRRAAGCGTCP
jgi:integrase